MIPDGARHFDDFDGLTYLNCAYQGPLPKVTQEAVRDILPLQAHPNRIPDDVYFRVPDRAREVVSPLIGADPGDITIGTGASHGVGVAALGFSWRPGDEVVVTANDFPSNIYLWSQAARRNGARAVLVEGKRHAATTDEVLAHIGSKTRVVAVSLVDFGSGEVMDLERLGETCRKQDIFLSVDATQAAGIVPLDVHQLPVSLLAVGAYKWMLSPYGTGYAYLSPEWSDRIEPSYVTWTAAQGAEIFNDLPRTDWKWVETARRFDAPETASFLNMTGLIRSAEFIREMGVERMHDHVTELLRGLEKNLPTPFRRRATPAPLDAPILSIESDDPTLAHTAARRLRDEGIRASLRDDGIRISPHIYNTERDIERLLDVLASSGDRS